MLWLSLLAVASDGRALARGPGRMVASIGMFLPGRQGKARGLMSQGDFHYSERGFSPVKMVQKTRQTQAV
jgi:hypothetical protein